MATAISRQAYFETGLEVLSERGYGDLKLAEVCNRLGVTTGSFYHYFPGWPVYTRELIEHWFAILTVQLTDFVRAEPDPRQRIDHLIRIDPSMLPHGAEAAIRAWSSADPDVHAVQVRADQLRCDAIYQSALEVLGNERSAQVFAKCAMHVRIGYEQASLPPDASALAWIADELLDALESGRFATAANA